MLHVISALTIYLLIINVIGFTAFYLDKRAALERRRRQSEASLLLIAAIGGTVGCFIAQKRFRHKTRKQPFKFNLQSIAVMQVALLIALCFPDFRQVIFYMIP